MAVPTPGRARGGCLKANPLRRHGLRAAPPCYSNLVSRSPLAIFLASLSRCPLRERCSILPARLLVPTPRSDKAALSAPLYPPAPGPFLRRLPEVLDLQLTVTRSVRHEMAIFPQARPQVQVQSGTAFGEHAIAKEGAREHSS